MPVAEISERVDAAYRLVQGAAEGSPLPYEGVFRAVSVLRAKAAEWRRIGDLVEQRGLAVYSVRADPVYLRWQMERDTAVGEARRRFRAAREDLHRAREDREQGLVVSLGGEAGRRVREWAGRYGVTPGRLLDELVEQARVDEAGQLVVVAFMPSFEEGRA
ncbi:hypothetical protein ACFV3E_42675 [Streptomyces sp. NPDC059718]